MTHVLGEQVTCSVCGKDFERWNLKRNNCRDCFREKARNYRKKNPQMVKEVRKRSAEKSRLIIEAGETITCSKCGESKSGTRFIPGNKVCKDCRNKASKEERNKLKKCQGFKADGSPCKFQAAHGDNNEKKYCLVHYKFIKEQEEKTEKIKKKSILCDIIDDSKHTEEKDQMYCEEKKVGMNDYQQLIFDNKNVRILGTCDQPWFIAKDIAEILGYKDTKKAVKKHVRDKNKKSLSDEGGRIAPLRIHPDSILINEVGLYSLILKSKLPKAQEFEDWVTSDVLPSLRKKGTYTLSEEKQEEFKQFNLKLKEAEEHNKRLQLECDRIKETNNVLEKKNKKLTQTINKYMKRHHYAKTGVNGACYYIYSVKCLEEDCKGLKIKHGIAGLGENDTLDDRLKSHRTTDPYMNLELVISSSEEKIVLLEKNMQSKHRNNLVTPNHEIFSSKQDLDELTDNARKIIDVICSSKTEYEEISGCKLIDYNKKIKDTMIKPHC